jgi:Mg2+-importing ATPase
VDVTDLVPGDVVRLQLGAVVPADLRLIEATGLECTESVLTGETAPAEKGTDAVAAGTALAELRCCAFMGTVVQAGSGVGVGLSNRLVSTAGAICGPDDSEAS